MNNRFSLIDIRGARFVILIFILSLSKNLACNENCSFKVEEQPKMAFKQEYIYWQPIFDNDFIATPVLNENNPFTLQPSGPGKKNKFDFSSGYRLSAIFFIPNFCSLITDGSFRFTYLPAQHARKISLASFLSILAETPENSAYNAFPKGHLFADHSLSYYGGDFFVTIPVFNISCFQFFARPGLHYANMKYKSHVDFTAQLQNPLRASIKEKSHSSGGGPQLNLTLTYPILEGLIIKGSFTEGILLSRADVRFKIDHFDSLESSLNSDVRNPRSLWKFFAFWEVNVGLCFNFSLNDYQIGCEVGYEYLSYPNFINRVQFNNDESGLKADNIFSNFDFQGPYASLLISF